MKTHLWPKNNIRTILEIVIYFITFSCQLPWWKVHLRINMQWSSIVWFCVQYFCENGWKKIPWCFFSDWVDPPTYDKWHIVWHCFGLNDIYCLCMTFMTLSGHDIKTHLYDVGFFHNMLLILCQHWAMHRCQEYMNNFSKLFYTSPFLLPASWTFNALENQLQWTILQ